MAGCHKMCRMTTARASLRNHAIAILAGKVPGCSPEHLVVAGRACAAIDARIDTAVRPRYKPYGRTNTSKKAAMTKIESAAMIPMPSSEKIMCAV